jgi:hypothetical protein
MEARKAAEASWVELPATTAMSSWRSRRDLHQLKTDVEVAADPEAKMSGMAAAMMGTMEAATMV